MPPKRKYIIPEVIQSSEMDCGPAALKGLLDGFNVPAHYGRLREACQTDVDGTSIDTLEELAVELGLDAEQIMIPSDHLFVEAANALPALVVIELPNRATHFAVVWRTHGSFVQVMDPAKGRYWIKKSTLRQNLYRHSMPVPASAWLEWACSEEFVSPLKQRIEKLKLPKEEIHELLDHCLSAENWQVLAGLDACTRMVQSLVDARAVRAGPEASRLFKQVLSEVRDNPNTIPGQYWQVKTVDVEEGEEEHVVLSGMVLVRVKGVASDIEGMELSETSSENVKAILNEPPVNPIKSLWHYLKHEGKAIYFVMFFAIIVASVAVVFEALLLRSFLDLGRELGVVEQRIGAVGALVLFFIALILIELPIASGLMRIGRNLEIRLRIAVLEKVPKLNDRFFQSRSMADTAERGNNLHHIRDLPQLTERILTPLFTLILTVAGIIWLDASSAMLAVTAAVFAVALPLISQFILFEQDMQVRTHEGALSHYYLDALQGLKVLRAHSAQTVIADEHERLLDEWSRSSLRLQLVVVFSDGLQLLSGFALAAWLIMQHFILEQSSSAILLLVYWALNLPVLGQQIALAARQYPQMRNHFIRILEPLSTPEEQTMPEEDECTATNKQGARIEFDNVAIRAAGHTILQDVNLDILPGEHVAVVGPSGAGKSSLVGALMGWHVPFSGGVRIDGSLLQKEALTALRRSTVWVDPDVRLWNQSLLHNLRYGAESNKDLAIDRSLQDADIMEVLKGLPEGLQSRLGEGGGNLSGGEAQRVRLARGLLKTNPRLVILDEPFRGLERGKRQLFLDNVRKRWGQATMLYISHDISDVLEFDRVLVIENGLLVESNTPEILASNKNSRFSQLLTADRQAMQKVWNKPEWRRLFFQNGTIKEYTPQ